MKKNRITIGLVQAKASTDPFENFERTAEAVKQAARKGAGLVCLQELFGHRYFCQKKDKKYFLLAEKIPGLTTKLFSKVAARYRVGIICPVFEKSGKRFFNTAVVIDPAGCLAGKYRKLHVPNDPLFYEKYYFCPGNMGVEVFSVAGVKFSVLICYDQWFPECARLAAKKGAQILFYPTAIGWLPSHAEEMAAYQQSWETIQASHAIANGVFVACVNRIGKEDRLKFWGSSFVNGPFGERLAQGSSEKEEVIVVECDMTQITKTRRGWPFLKEAGKAIERRSKGRLDSCATV